MTGPWQRELDAFLATRGIERHNMTPILKMRWLQEIVARGPIAKATIADLGRCLRDIGPGDECERYENHRLMIAFIRELRRHRHAVPMKSLNPAMTEPVLRQILDVIDRRPPRAKRSYAAQARTGLLIAWHCGFYEPEIQAIRKGWIERCREGVIIHIQSQLERKNIDFHIRRDAAFGEEACHAIRNWHMLVTDDPGAHLLPFLRQNGTLDWNRPMSRDVLRPWIRCALEELGIRERYSVRSFRRSFLIRSRENLGLLPALALAGYSDPRSLFHLLREDPDWSTARNLF